MNVSVGESVRGNLSAWVFESYCHRNRKLLRHGRPQRLPPTAMSLASTVRRGRYEGEVGFSGPSSARPIQLSSAMRLGLFHIRCGCQIDIVRRLLEILRQWAPDDEWRAMG